jgi:hypothetical protein
MRELTQKEIDDAPSWAVSYNTEVNSVGTDYIMYHERHYGFTLPLLHATPPRKEFDISEYVFSDTAIESVTVDGGVMLHLDYDTSGVEITEQDSILLAKHFGHYKET